MDYPNVILIVVDTLRDDYSYPLKENLKKFGFISYNNAIAPTSWTIPSHASLFTGLYPLLHKIHETKHKKNPDIRFDDLPPEITLQHFLGELGYESYLLSANPYISPFFGLSGFDYFHDTYSGKYSIFLSDNEQEYIDKLKIRTRTTKELLSKLWNDKQFKLLLKVTGGFIIWKLGLVKGWPFDMGARKTIEVLRRILKKENWRDSNPFFIFVNLMEVHEPYSRLENPQTLIKSFKRNLLTGELNFEQVLLWKQVYPKEVDYITERILEIIKILKYEDMFDNSIIIITSDHGQLLGEHGRIGHGTFLYDELLKVPLLVKFPKEYESHYPGDSESWISLTKIKQLILSVVENKLEVHQLYSSVVFAESYGIQDYINPPTDRDQYNNFYALEKYRIAIYYKNFKGIFNVTDWKFEEIISYDPKTEVTEDIVKHMKKEIIKFLKTVEFRSISKIGELTIY
ncbi:sulfatase-like hydrolase/transferase [Thermococcus peptonophilus]|uniref:Sulfatase N-terminal domain-containing protein n=1 Tax=Thermococcus peptonophilus TaxID=53952 RepID=A0A142CVP9_9EURY|nr:sulfatase-like hydrolase/transferase [Thermococcus peptonophilus]AMQ18851.1 hypothetical protein A0127_06520 [Thermococcus peptonophilus]